jgi:hypothetical protein
MVVVVVVAVAAVERARPRQKKRENTVADTREVFWRSRGHSLSVFFFLFSTINLLFWLCRSVLVSCANNTPPPLPRPVLSFLLFHALQEACFCDRCAEDKRGILLLHPSLLPTPLDEASSFVLLER